MENARIEYLPHCSKCGALIRERPRCVIFEPKVVSNNGETLGTIITLPRIEPERCENCGAFFEYIEIKPPVRV